MKKGRYMKIYADNAATTKISKAALDTMIKVMEENYGNPSSLYEIGQNAKNIIEEARETVAAAFGASPREIIFTSGGSESDNQAIITAAAIGEKKGKKHIISTAIEHHAVLHTLNKLKNKGFSITLLPVDNNGLIDLEELKNAITDDTCLVSVMFVNNEIGVIEPIEEIGKICKEKGVLFHTDAVQAAGHIKIDVGAMNIDLLSLSAHKFHGPKGIGALYFRKGIPLTAIIDGGAQERGKRAGTENVPAIAGMAVALKEATEKLESNAERTVAIRDYIIDGLNKIPYAELNGDRIKRAPSNINFCFEGIEGESLLLLLDDKGISASSGSACTSGSLDPSHVLLAIGRPHEVAHGSLRLSIDENLTKEEADYIIKTVKDTVEYLRNMSPLWRDLVTGKRKHIFEEY